MNKLNKLDYIVAATYIITLISIIFFNDVLLFSDALRLAGLFTIVICPIVGIVATYLSVKQKRWLTLIFSLILIFAFPVYMILGELLLRIF